MIRGNHDLTQAMPNHEAPERSASGSRCLTFDRLLMAVALMTGGVVLFAELSCAPQLIPVSSAQRPHPSLTGWSPPKLAKLLNRKASRGTLHLSLTLWDRAYVEAFLDKRASAQSWTKEKKDEAVLAWTRRFLLGQTSFRVRLDALDRPLTVEGADPVLALSSWRWELWDSEGGRTPATSARMETKKVFSASQGRFHFRVDGNIHFRYVIDPRKVSWLEVVAFPPGTQSGITLPRWHLKQ